MRSAAVATEYAGLTKYLWILCKASQRTRSEHT